MVIAVLSAHLLTVKSGIWRDIDLTAEDWIDPRRVCRLVKIDHAVHDTVIRDCRRCHAKFFDPRNIFLYFIGTVQKTVFCMDV